MPMTPRRLIESLARRLTGTAHRIEYAPHGWATQLPNNDREYWAAFIGRERDACEQLIARVRAGESIGGLDPDERVKHNTFAEVIEFVAQHNRRLAVLDIGGNLGDYYWVGKALVPGVELDFHCKELPPIAEAGRTTNPAVRFHTDDECFDRRYDLVMFSSSLQCLREWKDILGRAAGAGCYVFLSDVPTVNEGPSFVVVQRSGQVANLQYQFNRAEILSAAASAGLRVIREFAMGPHPPVRGVPEQPACVGWLFRR
jgi:putative methyltransferase (TIGR04325 family)